MSSEQSEQLPSVGESTQSVLLSPSRNVTTVMVIFSIDPSQQQEMLDHIMTYGGGEVKHQPGFLSSTLHRSIDGKRIVNYTQWRSREDYEAFISKSLGGTAPKIFQTNPPDTHIYEIVEQTIVGT